LTARRLGAFALAALAVLAVLVLVGGWERDRRAAEQARGMRSVVEEIGPLDQPRLEAFRYFQNFQCLAYRRDSHPLALELCVDEDGRVIEAIDRRSGKPRIWSLRDDRGRSTVRVDRAEVDRLLLRMGVPPRLIKAAHDQ
jgi:hypothetical protein